MSTQLRVALADGQTVQRAGIRYFLEKDADIIIVGETGNGEDVLHLLLKTIPNVLVLDMHLTSVSSLEIVHLLRKEQPHVHILALSTDDHEVYLAKILSSGVNGCLLRDEVPPFICDAVHGVTRHNYGWFSPIVTGKLLSQKSAQAITSAIHGLSERETQILHLIALGYNNPQIAEKLYLSLGTVKNYITTIYLKIQVTTRAKAITWAWQHGFFGKQDQKLVS